MYLLLSGEGPTDIGAAVRPAVVCEGEEFLAGPMANVVDQVVEGRFGYSPLETHSCGFVSEHHLVARSGELKAARKALRLPGLKRAKETHYFFNNARLLARIAQAKELELNVAVVAVLFRDSDGAASAERGIWSEKQKSMLDGFQQEGFHRGVPMIPKPKSEAWLLCALKLGYEGCEPLEERSGNDKSPNSLKAELEQALGHRPSRDELCSLVRGGQFDSSRINMPSFAAFRNRLCEVIE